LIVFDHHRPKFAEHYVGEASCGKSKKDVTYA
jgi:hypothetical protein